MVNRYINTVNRGFAVVGGDIVRTILKVLNTSVVLVESSENKQKMIVLGKGIGFGKKAGESIADESVDEILIPLESNETNRIAEFINEIPLEYFEITRGIVQNVEQTLSKKLNHSIYATLPDHLAFTVQRARESLSIPNRLYWEIKSYYPDEYNVCEGVVAQLNKRFKINLPNEEAARIAFHVIDALNDADNKIDGMEAIKFVGDIVNLVRYSVNKPLDTTSIHYARFITHVRFFVGRFLNGEQINGFDDMLFDQMWHTYPESMAIAEKVSDFANRKFQKGLADDEKTYLGVHINRLIKSADVNNQ